MGDIMSHGVNKVILVGNAAENPQVRRLKNGADAIFLRFVTCQGFKDKRTGEKKEDTQWHTVTFWGDSVPIVADFVKAGTKMYVEGTLNHHEYIDKDGLKHQSSDVRSDLFHIL